MTIALDTETFLIYPSNLCPTMVCTSWAEGKESGALHHASPATENLWRNAIQCETTFANAPFDLAVVARKWPDLLPSIFKALDEGRIHCVQMREKLIDLARGTFRFEEDEDGKIRAKGYSLFELTLRHLGKKLDKDSHRLKYHDYYDLPLDQWPQGARDYATDDAINTLGVHEKQETLRQSMLQHHDMLGNEAEQVRGHFALHLISCRGIRTDPAAVTKLQIYAREEIEKIRPGLIEAGLVRSDGTRNTKAAVRRMCVIMGDEAILTATALKKLKSMEYRREELLKVAREEGKWVSVSADSTRLTGDHTLMDYSRYTQMRGILNGPVKAYMKGTLLPLQTRFEPLLETGRTSSSGPNIQNVHRMKGLRECFVPRDGMIFVAGDYSSAELHGLSQVCFDLFGESKLGEALNAGIDVHGLVASQIMGIDYDGFMELYEAEDEYAEEIRQLAKAANFGFPGGCSPKRFVALAKAYGVEIDIRTAAQLKATWMSAWSEMHKYFKHVDACQDADGWHYVEHCRVDRIRARCTYTAACNAPFQGIISDGIKAALYRVAREQYVEPESDLFGSFTVNEVHDELILEAIEAHGHIVAMQLKKVMEEEMNKYLPDCPTHAEPALMRRWSKKAKPVWKKGRLQVWEPAA